MPCGIMAVRKGESKPAWTTYRAASVLVQHRCYCCLHCQLGASLHIGNARPVQRHHARCGGHPHGGDHRELGRGGWGEAGFPSTF